MAVTDCLASVTRRIILHTGTVILVYGLQKMRLIFRQIQQTINHLATPNGRTFHLVDLNDEWGGLSPLQYIVGAKIS